MEKNINILYVVDKKGRIQYSRAEILRCYDNKHNNLIFSLDQKRSVNEKYDIVYYSHFSQFKKLKAKGKIATFASITSHKCLSSLDKTLKDLEMFDRISVNNKYLFKEFIKYIHPGKLYYTPNGVKTDVFTFKDKPKENVLVLGWCGNRDRATKNYHTILKPLIKKFKNVNFKVIATSKRDKAKNLKSQSDMVKFYQSLDFLLVTSSTEGTPNPALEAMSCGTPVITTRVGNMEDIVENGKNGFFVSDNIGSFINLINKVKSAENYNERRQVTRSVIEKEWNWSKRSKAWLKFIHD